MANPLLCNVLTHFPPNKFAQSQLSTIFKTFCEKVHSSKSTTPFPYTKPLNSLFQNTTIKERRFAFDPEIGNNKSTHKDNIEEINTKALKKLSEISDECGISCLAGAGIDKKGTKYINIKY